ncbi:MAG: Ig-like domain-containing protein, partial [Verrucomicrobiota bacterium]
ASYVGTTVPVGSYALTAVATDAFGLVSTSAVVNITVAYVPPTVSLTSPASGTAFISPATVPLAATAAATGGTVTNVAFYNGSTLLANVTSAPYTYNWANVPAGSYTLTAQATDSNGATATSSAVSITVTNPLVASFTGTYAENFDLDLTNNTTTMPAGFQALGLAGDHFTFTNGIPITSNAIAAATAGVSSLTLWNAGNAAARAGSTLFNIGCWDSLNDRALGTDPTGNGGTVIQLALKNNTGNPLNGVVLSYTERCLTNGSTSNGSYTDDGTERLELPGYSFFYSLTGDTQPTNWFRVDALAQTNWVQGTSSDSGPVTITFPTPLPANGVMYFRWADDNCVASSPDQMFAIDNISVGLSQNLFQTALDAGPGFFSGENLYCTNASGSSYNVWSTTNISLSVTNWTLEGPTVEFPIANTPNSRYGITVTPTQSPTYYIFASTNRGPYAATEPLASLTTADYSTFNFSGANVPISADGIFLIEGITLIPTAQITAPASGGNYLPGTNVTISAMASELNGMITNVEFFANSMDLGGTTNSPYSLTWSNVTSGNYSLMVVASDMTGLTATSAVVNISVSTPNMPPTVSLTSPTNNAAFNAPASISLSATATDSDGTVTNIA